MSKTPPELFRAGFEIAQSFSDVANHLQLDHSQSVCADESRRSYRTVLLFDR